MWLLNGLSKPAHRGALGPWGKYLKVISVIGPFNSPAFDLSDMEACVVTRLSYNEWGPPASFQLGRLLLVQ